MNTQELINKLNQEKLTNEIVNTHKTNWVMYSKATIDESKIEKLMNKIKDFLSYIKNIDTINNKEQILYCVKQKADEENTYETGMIYKEDIAVNTPENNMATSLMCTPWNKIAGTEICPVSIEMYGEYEVAVQIIMEMTYFGFTPDEYDVNKKDFEDTLYEISKTIENAKDFKEVFPEHEGLDISDEIIKEIEVNAKLKEEFWNKVKANMKGCDVR